MDEPNSSLEDRTRELDAIIPSPEDRARTIYNFIKTHDPEFTNWDVICFAVNYLVMSGQSYEWMAPASIHLTKLVYNAHYLKTDELGLTQIKQPKRIITLEEWRNGV